MKIAVRDDRTKEQSGYVVITVSDCDIPETKLGFLIRRPSQDNGVLGAKSWQVSDYYWEATEVRRGTSVLEIVVGPDIVAQMEFENYEFHLIEFDTLKLIGSAVLVWSNITPLSQRRKRRRKVGKIGQGQKAAEEEIQEGIKEQRQEKPNEGKHNDADDEIIIPLDESNEGEQQDEVEEPIKKQDEPKPINDDTKRFYTKLIAYIGGGLCVAILIFIIWKTISDTNGTDQDRNNNNGLNQIPPVAENTPAVEAQALLNQDLDENNLIDSAKQFIESGHIGEARALLRRAIDNFQSPVAMRIVGELYDPRALTENRAKQMAQANARQAVRWYKKAKSKGDQLAVERLDSLKQWAEANRAEDVLSLFQN